MDQGYIKLDKLATIVEQTEKVACRLALMKNNDQWILHTLVADIFPGSLGIQSDSYDYNYNFCAFIADILPGKDVSTWLHQQSGSWGTYSFQFSNLPTREETQANWTRHPSHGNTGFASVSFPFTHYKIEGMQELPAPFTDFLISHSAPFFPDFRVAVAHLIYGQTDPYARQGLSTNPAIIVRQAQDNARIGQVDISPTNLSIAIIGTDASNTRLQISASPDLILDQYIYQRRETVKFPLLAGMPANVWIMLSKNNDWLDYIYYKQGRNFSNGSQPNVKVTPPDLRTRISDIISQGEGKTIEFKGIIPDEHIKFLKTIAAFVNGDGGSLLFGVDDAGDIVGLKDNSGISAPPRTKDDIQNMIRNNLDPAPEVHIECCNMSDSLPERWVFMLEIPAGNEKTRPCSVVGKGKRTYFVRRGATTFEAAPEEIRAIVEINPLTNNRVLSNLYRNGL